MRVLTLMLKDWLQLARDPKTALALFVMPLVFTLFFGFVFGGDTPADARLIVGVNDQDGGTESEAIRTFVDASDAIRTKVLTEAEAVRLDQMIEDEELAAALVIPPGYSEAVLAGLYPTLSLVVDQDLIAGQSARTALLAALQRYWGTLKIAEISVNASDGSPEGDVSLRENALRLAQERWTNPAITVVDMDYPREDESSAQVSNYYLQASPGMIVQFAIYGLMTAATALVIERKSGTLRRLLTTPISRTEILVGKGLAMFALVLFQELVLVVFGQVLFGVDYFREPLALGLVCISVAAWSASLGMLIGAISKREEGVIAWVLLAMFALAGLGGAWFPLEITSEAFAAVGHTLPSAWAMDGFQNLVLRGQGLESVLLPSAVMLAYAAAFLALAVWRFRFD